MTLATQSAPRLEEWAERHAARWEVWPLYGIVQGKRQQIGFRLELFAGWSPSGGPADRRQEALDVWERLEEAVCRCAPGDGDEVELEVEPYDGARRYGPETAWRPEVRLEADLVHRRGFFEPVDGGEREALKRIEERLHALGFRAGRR